MVAPLARIPEHPAKHPPAFGSGCSGLVTGMATRTSRKQTRSTPKPAKPVPNGHRTDHAVT